MIEFPITLTSGGSVCLPGYASALDAEDKANAEENVKIGV